MSILLVRKLNSETVHTPGSLRGLSIMKAGRGRQGALCVGGSIPSVSSAALYGACWSLPSKNGPEPFARVWVAQRDSWLLLMQQGSPWCSACRPLFCLPAALSSHNPIGCRSPQNRTQTFLPSLHRAGVLCFLAPFRSYQSPHSLNTAVPSFNPSPTPPRLRTQVQCAEPQRGAQLPSPSPTS
jgi:hypothetical protein